MVAIDGIRVTADGIQKLLARRRAGETMTVHAFRRDELIVVPLTLAEAPQDTCWMAVDKMAGDAERARRVARQRRYSLTAGLSV